MHQSTKGMVAKMVPSIMSLLLLVCGVHTIYSCGGGIMPYVPSGAGAGSGGSGTQFYLIDKSVTGTIMEAKNIQPLLKNIISAGNERKDRSGMKGTPKAKNIQSAAHTESIADTTTYPSSHDKDHCVQKTDTTVSSILNIHKLH